MPKRKAGVEKSMTKLPGNNNFHSIFNHPSLPPFYLIPTLPAVYPFTLLWFHPYCQWIAEWEAFSVSPSGRSELENSPAHSSGNRMVVDKAKSWGWHTWRMNRPVTSRAPSKNRRRFSRKIKKTCTPLLPPELDHIYLHLFSPISSLIVL